jgi:hypothetical protein
MARSAIPKILPDVSCRAQLVAACPEKSVLAQQTEPRMPLLPRCSPIAYGNTPVLVIAIEAPAIQGITYARFGAQ